jgi:hypothetical protein
MRPPFLLHPLLHPLPSAHRRTWWQACAAKGAPHIIFLYYDCCCICWPALRATFPPLCSGREAWLALVASWMAGCPRVTAHSGLPGCEFSVLGRVHSDTRPFRSSVLFSHVNCSPRDVRPVRGDPHLSLGAGAWSVLRIAVTLWSSVFFSAWAPFHRSFPWVPRWPYGSTRARSCALMGPMWASRVPRHHFLLQISDLFCGSPTQPPQDMFLLISRYEDSRSLHFTFLRHTH